MLFVPIPFLSILEINLHASMWFMIFAFALPYIVEEFLREKNISILNKIKNILPFIVTGLISFLVGFINPYGINSILYVFNSTGNKYINDMIVEMQPMSIKTEMGVYALIACIINVIKIRSLQHLDILK